MWKEKMTNILPHISISTSSEKNAIIIIEDYEIFDYISDYLTEKCDVEYDYMSEEKTSKNKTNYLMYFSKKYSVTEIENHLSKLKTKEIERIYSLNNLCKWKHITSKSTQTAGDAVPPK